MDPDDPTAGSAVAAAEVAEPPRSWPRRLLNRLEIDRAVFYALALRVWQLLAGAVSVVLISLFFTPDIQGYYYTFASLLALQSFFELGLHIVIISLASHEWAGLRLQPDGSIGGSADARSRLISLGRAIVRWYSVISLLFTVVVALAGIVFFSLKPAGEVAWFGPWTLLVVLTGLLLWILPLVALLEGCNQVATVNRFRLVQAISANAVVWAAIAAGWGLWAAVAAAAARLVCDGYLIGVRYGRFFRQFRRQPPGEVVRWGVDIWPMQWRIGLVGLFSYFEFAIYTPVMFYYHGSVLAGQMGMSWTLLMAVQAAALSWVQSRAPRFGMLISRREYRELDRVFLRLTAISLGALAAAALLAWSLVYGLDAAGYRIAQRLLPPLPLAVFFAAIVLYHVPRCFDIYVRAHKQEPMLVANIVSCCLIGGLVWLLGARYGAEGAAWGYLAVVALFNLPVKTLLWHRCRRRWHG